MRLFFLVSAAETTGATTAVCTGALGRDLKMEELQGSLAVDGFSSAISGCFWMPATDIVQPECRTGYAGVFVVSLLLSLLLPKKKQAN